jgi:hypothetical protein
MEDVPIPLALHPVSSHTFIVTTESGMVLLLMIDIRLFRYTPTDSIILLLSIETLNHITAS